MRNFSQLLFYSPIFFIFSLPFLVISGMYNPYEYPKFLLTLGYIQCYICYRVYVYITKDTPLFHKNKFSLFVILFLMYLSMSNMVGVDPYTSFMGSAYRHQGFLLSLCLGLFAILLSSLPATSQKKLFGFFAKASIVVLSFICCLTIIHALQFFIFHTYTVPLLQGRFTATFGNPNFLGGYVVMLVPLAIYGVTRFRNFSSQKQRIIQLCLIGLAIITLALSASISALLACIVIIIVFVSLKLNVGTWKRNMLALIVLVALLCIIFFSIHRFSPWDNRGILWLQALQALEERPVFGYGQENFQLIIKDIRFYSVDSAHNIFIETAVSSGLFGLFLFLLVLYQAFKQAPYALRLSLLAFLITAQFNPLSIAQLALFWSFLGCTTHKKNT